MCRSMNTCKRAVQPTVIKHASLLRQALVMAQQQVRYLEVEESATGAVYNCLTGVHMGSLARSKVCKPVMLHVPV
jgi:hypothetical protein